MPATFTAGQPATAPGPGKAHLKKEFNFVNALGAERQSLTVLSCLPHLQKHNFML